MKIQFDINTKDGTITNVSMWDKIESRIFIDHNSSQGVWYKNLYGFRTSGQTCKSARVENVTRYYIDTTLLSGNNSIVASNYVPTAIRMYREQVIDELI